MNDYCDFMEEYQAEGRPASMLAEYGEMMGKYADMAAKFDAIDEGSLSADDDAYYIQVQTRVNQRLLAVAAQYQIKQSITCSPHALGSACGPWRKEARWE